MFEAYRVGVTLTLTNHLAPQLAQVGREVGNLKRGVTDLNDKLNTSRVAAMGFVGVLAGAAMAGAIAQVARLGEALVQQEALLRAAGYTAEEVGRSTARAWEITGQVRGTTASGNLRIINEGRTTFGSLEASERFAPMVARFERVLTATGARNAEREANYHARAIELRGRANPNRPEEFTADMNRAAAMQVAFGGRVTGRDLANFMQRAGLAGRMMDADVFYSLVPSIVQATGSGDTAGTMFAALFRQMVGGVMTQQQANRLADAGILEQNAPRRRLTRDEFNRRRARGEFDRSDQYESFRDQVVVTPRSLVDSELFARDPRAWAARHLTGENGAFARLGRARGRELTDAEKTEWMAQAFGTETARRLVGILTLNSDNIAKDNEAYQRVNAQGPAGIDRLLNESPVLAMNNLGNSFKALGEALGAPAMRASVPLLNQAADGIGNLARHLNANPEMAGRLMTAGVAVAGVLLVGGAIAMVGAALTFIGAPILLFLAAVTLAYASFQAIDWSAAWQALIQGVTWAWEQLSALGQQVLSWLGETFAAPLGVLSTALGAFFTWFGQAVAWFVGLVPGLSGALSGALTAMTEALRGMASRIGEWVSGLGGRAAAALGLGGGGAAPQAPPMAGMPNVPMPGAGLPSGAPPPPPPPQPIVIHNRTTLDGRVVADSVTTTMANQANAPAAGRTGFDPRRSVQTPGAMPG